MFGAHNIFPSEESTLPGSRMWRNWHISFYLSNIPWFFFGEGWTCKCVIQHAFFWIAADINFMLKCLWSDLPGLCLLISNPLLVRSLIARLIDRKMRLSCRYQFLRYAYKKVGQKIPRPNHGTQITRFFWHNHRNFIGIPRKNINTWLEVLKHLLRLSCHFQLMTSMRVVKS